MIFSLKKFCVNVPPRVVNFIELDKTMTNACSVYSFKSDTEVLMISPLNLQTFDLNTYKELKKEWDIQNAQETLKRLTVA